MNARHLLTPEVDRDVFVTDIANVLIWEDLHDVVLVGHSFGGAVISGVADRMPERIRRLVYLDAMMLEHGQRPFDVLPPDVVAARTKAAQDSSGGLSMPVPPASAFGISDPAQAAWVEARMTPHPFATYTTPHTFRNPIGNGLPATYVVCTDPLYGPAEASRAWVRAAGWRMVEIATGHDAMVIAPDRLADLLDAEGG